MSGGSEALKVVALAQSQETVRRIEALVKQLPDMDLGAYRISNGEDALRVADAAPSDCLLVEWPGRPGQPDWLRRVASRIAPRPLVALAAQDYPGVLEQALEAGAFDCLLTSELNASFVRHAVRSAIARSFVGGVQSAEPWFSLALAGVREGFWDWDLRAKKVRLSTGLKKLLGLKPDDESSVAEEQWLGRIHPDHRARVREAADAHVRGVTPEFEAEFPIRYELGNFVWVRCQGRLQPESPGRPPRLVGSLADVSDRKAMQERLLRASLIDPITELPNRTLFLDRLDRALARAKRSARYQFAVLFLDLDRFKFINDSLGHQTGDRLLMLAAERLKTCVRSTDTVARLGGDEFAILVEDLIGADHAVRVAARIHDAFLTPFKLDGREVFSTVSIGIALSTREYASAEECLRDADTAMYGAKGRGKATTQVFETRMHTQANRILELENDLRRAFDASQFECFYQPIVSIASQRIVGFEALVRWKHPQRGWISPADFVPLAEETGLVVRLDRLVLAQACRQIKTWQERFRSDLPLSVAVNFSGLDLHRNDLVQVIDDNLRHAGLSPRCLRFEITETVLMEHSREANRWLNELRSKGIQISIDDFGTGFSSLASLNRFPVDILKIDRSFIQNIHTLGNFEIIRAIVQLAKALSMTVVAEGVETLEQLEALRRLGCEYGQGFLFSRPVPAAQAEELLRRQHEIHELETSSDLLRLAQAQGPSEQPSYQTPNEAALEPALRPVDRAPAP